MTEHTKACDYTLFHGRAACNKECWMPEVDRLKRDLARMTGYYHEMLVERDAWKARAKAEAEKWRERAS